MRKLTSTGVLKRDPILESVAAVSVGIVDGVILLDLNYEEDSSAEVDMNFVMTASNRFVEVQGTAESKPFGIEEMDAMRALAISGITRLFEIQRKVLAA